MTDICTLNLRQANHQLLGDDALRERVMNCQLGRGQATAPSATASLAARSLCPESASWGEEGQAKRQVLFGER